MTSYGQGQGQGLVLPSTSHSRPPSSSPSSLYPSRSKSPQPPLVLPAWQLPHNKQPKKSSSKSNIDTKDTSKYFNINNVVDNIITDVEIAPKTAHVRSPTPTRPNTSSPVTKRNSKDASRGGTATPTNMNHMDEVMQKVNRANEKRQMKRVKDEMATIAKKIEKIEQFTQDLQEKQKQAQNIPENISSKLTEINSRVYWLDRVFFTAEERVRDTAATKICSVVRGYLVRRRFKLAKMSLQSYKERVTADVGGTILSWLAQRALLYKKSKFRQSKEMQQIGKKVFVEWHEATKVNSPFWADLREKAKKLIALHTSYVARRLLREWRDTAMGPHSRKAVAKAYRERYRKAEQKVVLRAESGNFRGKLDPKMVERQISEDMVNYVINIRNKNLTRLVLVSWHLVAVQKTRKQRNAVNAKAVKHYQHKLMRAVLEEWHEITRVSKYEHGPERWLHRKNKNVATYQTNVQILKKSFSAWRRTSRTRAEAQRRFLRKRKEFMQKIISLFRNRVVYEKRLKMKVIDKWIRTKELAMRHAFQSWYLYTVNSRLNNTHKRMILRALARRKSMRNMRNCFIAWKAFVLDREKIMWEQQTELLMAEVHSLRKENSQLVSNMERFTLLVTDFEKTVEVGQEELKEKEDILRVKNEELLELKFSLHHSKQEVERLRTIIDNNGLNALVNIKKMLKFEEEAHAQKPRSELEAELPKNPGVVTQFLEEMAEENAKFLKKIGSNATAPLVSNPNPNPLSPRQQHKQQLERLMNQQQKQKEELNKLFAVPTAPPAASKSPRTVSREEFFQQRVSIPTDPTSTDIESPNEFSVFLHDVRSGIDKVDQALASIPSHNSHRSIMPQRLSANGSEDGGRSKSYSDLMSRPSRPASVLVAPNAQLQASKSADFSNSFQGKIPLNGPPHPTPDLSKSSSGRNKTTGHSSPLSSSQSQPFRPSPLSNSATQLPSRTPSMNASPINTPPISRTSSIIQTAESSRSMPKIRSSVIHEEATGNGEHEPFSDEIITDGFVEETSAQDETSSFSSKSYSFNRNPNTADINNGENYTPDYTENNNDTEYESENNTNDNYNENDNIESLNNTNTHYNDNETSEDYHNLNNTEDYSNLTGESVTIDYSQNNNNNYITESQFSNNEIGHTPSFDRSVPDQKMTRQPTNPIRPKEVVPINSNVLLLPSPRAFDTSIREAPAVSKVASPRLVKSQSAKFTQQVENLREKINTFKMYLPQQVPNLASLSGFTQTPASASAPVQAKPSEALYSVLAGQRPKANDKQNPVRWGDFLDSVGSQQLSKLRPTNSASEIQSLKQQLQQQQQYSQMQQSQHPSKSSHIPIHSPSLPLPSEMPQLRTASLPQHDTKKKVVITSPKNKKH